MIHDDYQIDKQWQEFKKIFNEIEPDVYKFIGKKKNKVASERVRNKLNELRKMSRTLRISILNQRKDNDADYQSRQL